MFVLFVRPNHKLCTISLTNALTQGDFGTILNLIGANKFVFLLQNVIFGIISAQYCLKLYKETHNYLAKQEVTVWENLEGCEYRQERNEVCTHD